MKPEDFLTSVADRDLVEQLFDLMDAGVVIHDHQRIIYLVNKETEKITGRSKDEIYGLDCHAAFPPNGMCGAACAHLDKSNPDESRREHTVTFVRADGQTRKIKVRSDSIELPNGRKGVLAVIRDITEISNLRFKLERHAEFHGMIGVSRRITEVFETIRAVGASNYPVLITGESGTGKELAAGAIHQESSRKAGPFVPVNCGALPENILESELFGHVRGAFTGAIRDKKGRFELADGGTLFLDEVGELPLHVQVKLLRVLQEKVFERVGGEQSVRSDVRIVAATNRNLREMILRGEFREDLYYRLCVVPIELPALRERMEDVPHIADKILTDIARETGKEQLRLDDNSMQLMLSHAWPGNIRELINALQYASVRCSTATIVPSNLPLEMRMAVDGRLNPTGATPKISNLPLAPNTGQNPVLPPLAYTMPQSSALNVGGTGSRTGLTSQAVTEALTATGGNKVKAAKLLGVGRATLYRFLDANPIT